MSISKPPSAKTRPPAAASLGSSSSLVSTGAVGGGSAGAEAKTEEDRNREMVELLEKLKKASQAPEQATRRVRDLDRIVSALRKHRAECAAAIEADKQRLADLEKQEGLVRGNLNKLEARLDEHEQSAERIREQIEQATQHLSSFVSAATNRVTITRVTSQQQQRRQVSEHLRVERGYTVGRDDKTHLQVPESVKFKARLGSTK